MAIGIILGILIDIQRQTNILIYEARADEGEVVATSTESVAAGVLIRVEYDKAGIEKLIRETFPEAPNTAVAIAKCESGLKATARAQAILSYGQESSWGIFQIHKPDWDARANKLGYGDYETDVEHNIKMARHIYDGRGSFKDWSCYNNGGYKRYL